MSESDTEYESINHPEHYDELFGTGIECIDIAECFNFNLGQVVKYIWRAGKKPGEPAEKDLEKAIWYLGREIYRIKSLRNQK